jgi:hypothetical protein
MRKPLITITIMLVGLSANSALPQGYNKTTPDTTGQSRKTVSLGALLAVQTAAEDIVDFAMVKDWVRVGSDVAALEAAWARYDSLGRDPMANMLHTALGNNLNQLKEALKGKNSTSAIQSASNLSFAIGNLLQTQHTVIPPDLLLMEILERQLSADGAVDNFLGAERSFDKLKMIWDRTRGKVQDRKGFELAGKFTASLRAQEIAIGVDDGPATGNEASKGLALLQDIEKLFK